MEPLAIGHNLVSLVRQVIVAGHDRNTLNKDFSIFCDLDEVSRKGQTYGSYGILTDMLYGDRSGRFG